LEVGSIEHHVRKVAQRTFGIFVPESVGGGGGGGGTRSSS
jgi:hypothetical protein